MKYKLRSAQDRTISIHPDVQTFLLASATCYKSDINFEYIKAFICLRLTDNICTPYPHIILTRPELISVALIQQEYGTPQRSTLGDVQLKYSFFDQSI